MIANRFGRIPLFLQDFNMRQVFGASLKIEVVQLGEFQVTTNYLQDRTEWFVELQVCLLIQVSGFLFFASFGRYFNSKASRYKMPRCFWHALGSGLGYLWFQGEYRKLETHFFRSTYLKSKTSFGNILRIIRCDLELAKLDHLKKTWVDRKLGVCQ